MKRASSILLASFLCIIFSVLNVNVFADNDLPIIIFPPIDMSIRHTKIKMVSNITISEEIDGVNTVVTEYTQTASSDGYIDTTFYDKEIEKMKLKHRLLINNLRNIGAVIKDEAKTNIIEERTESITMNSGRADVHKYQTYIMTYDIEVQYNPVHAIKTYTDSDNYTTISLSGGHASEPGDYSEFDGKHFKLSGSDNEAFALSVNYDEETGISTLTADIPEDMPDGEYYIDEGYVKTGEAEVYKKSTFEEVVVSNLPFFVDQYTQRTDEFSRETRYTRIHTSVITPPDKPILFIDGTYTYNGMEQTAGVNGYDSETMNIRNNVKANAGTYRISVTSKFGRWADNSGDPAYISWTIDKAKPTGAPKYTAVTSAGKTLADAAITVEGSTFNVPGSVKWIDDDGADIADTTAVEMDKYYKWLFTPTDTDNYETLTGEVKIYSKPRSGSLGNSTPAYTVSFETNGGSKISSLQAAKNTTLKEPAAPTKDGFDFTGWYTDKDLKTKYDFSDEVTSSFTLYAAWTEKTTDSPNNEIILTIGQKKAYVFGKLKTNDVAPIIVNNRTMLPARFVAESLGAEVQWNEEKSLVTINGKNEDGKDVTILITIGEENAAVNGETVKLDSPAFIENGRTYTPVHFIAEQFGVNVMWEDGKREIVITVC